MLDALLLCNGTSKVLPSTDLPDDIILICLTAFKTLCALARWNIKLFQNVMGVAPMSTEFFHLIMFWTNYFTKKWSSGYIELLFQNICLLLGYFCFENVQNQNILLFGSSPNILQLLTMLPFKYFNSQK